MSEQQLPPEEVQDPVGAAPASPPPLGQREIRARQRSRSLVMGLILGGLAILFYAIAIAKLTGGGG